MGNVVPVLISIGVGVMSMNTCGSKAGVLSHCLGGSDGLFFMAIPPDSAVSEKKRNVGSEQWANSR